MSACCCSSEMCRRFGCQKDAQLLKEYQAEKARIAESRPLRDIPVMPLRDESIESVVRRVIREELDRRFGPASE